MVVAKVESPFQSSADLLHKQGPVLWQLFQALLGEIEGSLADQVLSEDEDQTLIYLAQTPSWPAFAVAHPNLRNGKHKLPLPIGVVQANVLTKADLEALAKIVEPWHNYPIDEPQVWAIGIGEAITGIAAKQSGGGALTMLRPIQVVPKMIGQNQA